MAEWNSARCHGLWAFTGQCTQAFNNMEKRIKTLYLLSIVAILAFLGMQAYWLYARYDYSLSEYEDRIEETIETTLDDYKAMRAASNALEAMSFVRSTNKLSSGADSVGRRYRNATITQKVFDGKKLLGINDDRKLTEEEMDRLAILVGDSLATVDEKTASFDASSAPSDGASWNAMKNFEIEYNSPFTVEGIDSLLRKENIDAAVTLTLADSMIWKPLISRHVSVLNPHFIMTVPYSELEKKTVVIDCLIPASEVINQMGRTLVMAAVLSLFLIVCLVWQIKTIAKLTRLDKMRSMFVSTMIHELKRPISTLKICVSGFDNDKLMADGQLRKELAGETRVALDNLSAYFSKLRDITFNNVEQIPLNVTSFNLSDLVGAILKSISVPSTKHAVFEQCIPPDIQVSADRSHLANILTNLVENAIKYSGEEVKVTISAGAVTNGIAIAVADNGNGIQAADRERIFHRFYRGKAAATDIPGMGLGLAYVKLLTAAHGGEISVESTEGAGSTFTIILPQ